MIRMLLELLAAAAGIYSILIFIRIIMSWFGNLSGGKPLEILCKITDPYLGWWRKNLPIRVGFLDFSVLAAIVFLSIVQRVLFMVLRFDRITLGSILAIILVSVWNIVSFIIGFFIVIILMRLFAYFTNRNTYSPFWQMVETISQPVLYRLNRILFGDKIVGYLKGILLSLLLLTVIIIGGGFAVNLFAGFLSGFPI